MREKSLIKNPVGRPVKDKSDYLEDYHYSIALLLDNISIRKVAEITEHSVSTILKLKKMFL
ncbi:MAG: hypothetical protein J1F38_08770 [Muribaculaceae bacterium]|nr:hypothetical protein [Muribaculaceae bacterium]